MACPNVFDAFRVATEDLNDEVYRLASYRSIWLNLIRRSSYPKGIGLTRSVFTVRNTEPYDDEPAWSAISLATGTGVGACANTWNDVEVGFDEETYSPSKYGIRGPVLCKDDLIFDFNVETFLQAYVEELAKRAQRQWELEYQKQHIAHSRKVIADTSLTITDQAGLTGLTQAQCQLTQEMLDQLAIELIDAGATTPDSNGFITWQDSGPVFSLYIGMDQSNRILKTNAEERDDFRWADPSMLIARIGASRVIKNFRHIINLRPPRYTFAGGTYTRVNTFDSEAATKGTGSKVSDAWRAAPYEGAIVLSDRLFTSEIIQPVNSAPGVKWDPTNFMGDWQWVTGGNKISSTDCEDPLEKLGRHYAEFGHAPRPMDGKFKYGMLIIYKRCYPLDVECTTCSSS